MLNPWIAAGLGRPAALHGRERMLISKRQHSAPPIFQDAEDRTCHGRAADHTKRPEIKLQAAQAYRMASATMIRLVHRRCAIGDPAAVEC
jgi:hypothetical protein